MGQIGKLIGVGLLCGSLMVSSSVAAAANSTQAAQSSSQWTALSAMGTASSAAAVSAAQENPNRPDPYADHSGHGLGPSAVLLGLAILLVVAVIAFAHDKDDENSPPISPF